VRPGVQERPPRQPNRRLVLSGGFPSRCIQGRRRRKPQGMPPANHRGYPGWDRISSRSAPSCLISDARPGSGGIEPTPSSACPERRAFPPASLRSGSNRSGSWNGNRVLSRYLPSFGRTPPSKPNCIPATGDARLSGIRPTCVPRKHPHGPARRFRGSGRIVFRSSAESVQKSGNGRIDETCRTCPFLSFSQGLTRLMCPVQLHE